jgi:hypothetical protein
MAYLSDVKPSRRSEPERNFIFQLMKLLAVFFLFFDCATAGTLPTPMSLDWGPQSYSFAGAAAAMVNNQDAFLTNPAGLVFFSGSGALQGSWQTMPGDQDHWTTSVVDGTHDLIGGFQFAESKVDDLSRQNFTITGSYKTPYGSFGISAHALKFGGVPSGRGWHFTNTIGILAPVGELFTIGIYSKSPYDLEDRHSQLPPSIHMAIMYAKASAFRVSFESGRRFRIPDQDWYYAAAGDILLQDYLAVRGGYRWEIKNERSFWSAGAALIAPKVEITGVYIRMNSGPPSNGYGFDLNFRF